MFVTLVLRMCVLTFISMTAATISWSSIVAKHDPLHPDTNEPVRLSARATGEPRKIMLYYERYTLSRDATGKQTQVLVDSEKLARTCAVVENVRLLECTHQIKGGFPAASVIKYKAVATFKDGSESVETYSFAAGAFPWPDQPIPIRQTGNVPSRLDIIFIPTKDLVLSDYKKQLSSVIHQLYFKYPWYGGTERTNYRNMFNFWYSEEFGDYQEGCHFDDPSNIASLLAIGDAVVFLHKENMRDCAIGKQFSSEIDYDKTLIHESGHALFDLMDEYCCDSFYEQRAQFPNIWRSLAACQADAPNVLYPKSNCTQIADGPKMIDFWRIDPETPAPGSIMGSAQYTSTSTHLNAGIRRILWTFDKCLSGDCTASASSAAKISQRMDELEESLRARINDAGKGAAPAPAADTSLIMAIQVRIAGDTAKIERTQIIRGTLPKSVRNAGLSVKAMSATNDVLHQYMIDDPRWAEVEGRGYVKLPDVKTWVFAPATASLKEVELASAGGTAFLKREPLKSLRLDLSPGISKLCEGIGSIEACFRAERR